MPGSSIVLYKKPTTILATLRRFVSPPLASIKSFLTSILEQKCSSWFSPMYAM